MTKEELTNLFVTVFLLLGVMCICFGVALDRVTLVIAGWACWWLAVKL